MYTVTHAYLILTDDICESVLLKLDMRKMLSPCCFLETLKKKLIFNGTEDN